jgi:peptide/nickel transport system permease protein
MAVIAAKAPTSLAPSRGAEFWRLVRRIRRSTSILIGATLLLILIVVSLGASVLSSYDPVIMNTKDRQLPPSAAHPFGTDNFGRDVYTRVLYGGRISLQVGIISVTIGALAGTLLGLLAAFYRGWVDALIMRFVDVLMAFPSILLALAIVAFMGRSLPNVMIAVGISNIPVYARIVRGSALSIQQMEYVTAANLIGCRPQRVMLRHVLPNILAPIIVITTNGIAGAVISGAALSFLGLGVQPPTPEWGIMLSEGRALLRSAWWVTTFPGLAIMVTVMAINLIGDGLRDVLDPRLRL